MPIFRPFRAALRGGGEAVWDWARAGYTVSPRSLLSKKMNKTKLDSTPPTVRMMPCPACP
ncbi:hypothetical protein GCM10017624_27000 [Azotobacter vinelandii]|nr:hypothetical protein GCM10017624_27000 [Azotobacter vinelandii]